MPGPGLSPGSGDHDTERLTRRTLVHGTLPTAEWMSPMDYAGAFDNYWSEPGRWGSHALNDTEAVADHILRTCGGGSMLDVGCGMGRLARTLLARGVDVHGVDVASRVIHHLDGIAPGRFHEGSILALPFADASFQTVLCTDTLEHLAEADVPAAIRELHRVARRYAFVVLSTTPDRDGKWHLTVHDRDWWEARFFCAGFRRHPLFQTVCPYETLEHDAAQITIVLEKIPAEAARTYTLERLQENRILHTDMLRESGRRSDAHVARYMLASTFVRAGDTVLDVACGLGYGSAILAAASPAAQVIGIDSSAYAIDYARANYGALTPELEFDLGDATDLTHLDDVSIDFVASMETLEHLEHPEQFLAEIKRVLRPGGRVALSVPNEWVDETGRDPNPHHLHVYTWDKLRGQLCERFIFERAWSQIAGGAMKLTHGVRQLQEVPVQASQTAEAEWWLVLAMKDPVGAGRDGYRDTEFADAGDVPGCHLTRFERDYDNPWLFRGMIGIGRRCSNAEALEMMARRVAEASREGSADEGAALCVLAYRLLDDEAADAVRCRSMIARLQQYDASADASAHGARWRISNRYVSAMLLLRIGDRDAARRALLACAELDPLQFSPLLATKTVDALFQAGVLAAFDGQVEEAARCWRRGLSETRRVLQGDWASIRGRIETPLSFGLPEVAQLTDLATRCANGLVSLPQWSSRPGLGWSRTSLILSARLAEAQRTACGLRSHAEKLQQTLDRELAYAKERTEAIEWLKSVVEHRDRQIGELNAALGERDRIIAARDAELAELKLRLARFVARTGAVD